MDLFKTLFIISVTIGASVSQDRLYTLPFPPEAIEAANSILMRRERPIDDQMISIKNNVTQTNSNLSQLIFPIDKMEEEKDEEITADIDGTVTTITNDLALNEERNDKTIDIPERISNFLEREYDTSNFLEDGRVPLEALGRAIGGGGIPGADYPVHYEVPETEFTCIEGPLVGYYADTHPEAACQVFHICQEDGRHDAFLCPIGTLFNQKYFVCDWWYNVDCNRSSEYYFLNEFLLRENSNKGLRPLSQNLKNRTEYMEQIIEEIKNAKGDSRLFANNYNKGDSPLSELSPATEVNSNIGDIVEGELQSREIEVNDIENQQDEKVDVEVKEDKVELKKEALESAEGTFNEEGVPNNEILAKEIPADEGEAIYAEGTTEKEFLKSVDEKIDTITTKIFENRDQEYKNAPADAEPANAIPEVVVEKDDIKTTKFEESDETEAVNKDSAAIGSENNLSSSKVSSNILQAKEKPIGYSYEPKVDSNVEDILNKRISSLNSYGVDTDDLVNKKGIRN